MAWASMRQALCLAILWREPRPELFDAAASFEPYEKPCGRGNIPRPALPCGLLIAPLLFELLAPTTGAKEKQSMRAKIKYTNEPLGDVKVIADFLPSPAELAFNEESVKVTLAEPKKH